MTLKVSHKENNVVFLSAKTNLMDTLEEILTSPSEQLINDTFEFSAEDFYDEVDPLDIIIEDLIATNIFSAGANDLGKACESIELYLGERQAIIDYIPNRNISGIRLLVSTPVGDSLIVHNPVQCSDIEFGGFIDLVEE